MGIEQAVENPLAREIVAACGKLRLETLFEPTKIHPKDWANPGRVKIRVKGGLNKNVKNSMFSLYFASSSRLKCLGYTNKRIEHHLYTLISQHLIAHPTTPQSAILVKVPGVPPPDLSKPYPAPAIPKGWKMGSILPYYSPGLTGGGVSENFFKEMMAEMQGQVPGMPNMGMMEGPSSSGGGGGEAKPKKEKKKKIKG